MQLDMDGWTLIRCRATEIGSVNEYERIVQTIQKYFGRLVFETYIRDNVALAEAPAQRKDIFAYSGSSSGAEDYLNLSKEIMELLPL